MKEANCAEFNSGEIDGGLFRPLLMKGEGEISIKD
jgi:hypothetical protein